MRNTIGLLGGSFNPAHEGHIHISLEAVKRLELDEVWWLISPQNPLKSTKNMPSVEQRTIDARGITKNIEKIKISNLESELSTQYSCHTIEEIQQKFPETNFIWLIGADNLQIFHKWMNWRNILDSIAIAVFDRKPYTYQALASNAAISYSNRRILDESQLTSAQLPAWSYIRIETKDISSTEIRGGENE